VYSIESNTELLIDHVSQLVQVRGRAEPAVNHLSKLAVSSVQVVADTCTANSPGAKTQTVVGKAGAGQVAIPVTTTASPNETTPGFQTEAGMAELSGSKNPPAPPDHAASRPYAPLEAEQIAQSEATANVNAQAVLRTEILPGNTLGVSTAPNSPAGSNGAISNYASYMPPHGAKMVVVEITGDQTAKLSPQRVNIRAGETIQWKNSSGTIHEIIANPAKARAKVVPSLPAGATPFDSGFLRPDRSFSYRFFVPGVYRYVCDLEGAQPVMGEIVVAQ
jgi:plastocyanin